MEQQAGNEHFKDFWKLSLQFLFRISFIFELFLFLAYSLTKSWAPSTIFKLNLKDFLLAVMVELFSAFAIYIASYIFFNSFRELKKNKETEGLIDNVAKRTRLALDNDFNDLRRKILLVTRLVKDSLENGVERVCDNEEVGAIAFEQFKTTKVFKLLGIGNQWFIDSEKWKKRLVEMLKDGHDVYILIPDPLAPLLQERYENDEPPEHKLNLVDLALLVLWWHKFSKSKKLHVKVYHRYPVVNVSIYDEQVFVSPVLYKQQGKKNLTIIYRKSTDGSDNYEEHFQQIWDHGSNPITPEYIAQLEEVFHLNQISI